MPLHLTPATPFQATNHLEVLTVYAIVNVVGYTRTGKAITFEVGYYASEAACDAGAEALRINALPVGFQQAATPEQANGLPIFDFLDAVLSTNLQALHSDCVIERVA